MLKKNKMKFIMLFLCTFFVFSLMYKQAHAQDNRAAEMAADVDEEDTSVSVGVLENFSAIDWDEMPLRDQSSQKFDAEKFRQSTQKIPLGTGIRPAEKIDFSKRLKETSEQKVPLDAGIRPEERSGFSKRLKEEAGKRKAPPGDVIKPEEKANFSKKLKETGEQKRKMQTRSE